VVRVFRELPERREEPALRLKTRLLLFECIGYVVVGLALYGAYALVRDVWELLNYGGNL
jgi:hypothetical protein